jgi:hypothetical protein
MIVAKIVVFVQTEINEPVFKDYKLFCSTQHNSGNYPAGFNPFAAG